MRVQAKPLIAEAWIWSGESDDFVVFDPIATKPNGVYSDRIGQVRYPYKPSTAELVQVKFGDWIVKHSHRQIVDVLSTEEFHKRFIVVEPGAVEIRPVILDTFPEEK